nr:uncharacterized protein LOC107772263 [Ipomoea batatas]
MRRKKSKRRWTNFLLPRKFCSVFSYAFGSRASSRCESTEMESMSRDHEGGDSSGGGGGRGRASKIARIRSKWRKRDDEENTGSRFSALFGLGKKDSEFGFNTWKISPVNKVGTSEDSFAAAAGDHREIQTPEFNRKTEEEDEGLELCKKRILMGERCRALSTSGSLHYDGNGVLLPEFLP